MTPPVNQQVLTALDRYTTELSTPGSQMPFKNGCPLEEIVDGAQIIALGEATHGTREFVRLKHRFLQCLVVNRGVRALLIEANFAETIPLYRYVVFGEGDPVDAVQALRFWTWQSEAILEMVKWLRAFNRDRPVNDRVRIFGIDVQSPEGSISHLHEYFRRVDASLPEFVRVEFDSVEEWIQTNGTTRESEISTNPDRFAAMLRNHLQENKSEYADHAGMTEWKLALGTVTALEFALVYRRNQPPSGVDTIETMVRLMSMRDRAMTAVVEWVIDSVDAEPIVVWGHDAHINRQKQAVRGTDVAGVSLGSLLTNRHGDAYRAVGFAFGRGSFRALGGRDSGADSGRGHRLQNHTLESPLSGTVEDVFDALEQSPMLVNVRAARMDDRLSALLSEPCLRFSVGGAYDPESPRVFTTEYILENAFDALCYVSTSSPPRLLTIQSRDSQGSNSEV